MKNLFKNLSLPELRAKRDELKRKYMELRFQMIVGHVDNPLLRRTMRRQIAQLNTLIHAHVLTGRKAVMIQAIQGAQGAEAR